MSDIFYIGGLKPADAEIIWKAIKQSGRTDLNNPAIQRFQELIRRDREHFTVFRLRSPTEYFTVSNKFLEKFGLNRAAMEANFHDLRMDSLDAANEAETKRAKKKEKQQKVAKKKKTKKKTKKTTNSRGLRLRRGR